MHVNQNIAGFFVVFFYLTLKAHGYWYIVGRFLQFVTNCKLEELNTKKEAIGSCSLEVVTA